MWGAFSLPSPVFCREAIRNTENMNLSQRLLVADAHRQIREDRDDDSDESDGSTSKSEDSETSGRSPQVPRGRFWRIRFDSIDCRPTCYHPGGFRGAASAACWTVAGSSGGRAELEKCIQYLFLPQEREGFTKAIRGRRCYIHHAFIRTASLVPSNRLSMCV